MRQWRTGYKEWSVAPSPPPAPDWVISTSPPPLLRLSRTHTLVHCWSPPFHSINLICSLVLSVTRSGSDVISASLLPPVPTPYFLPAARPSPVQCPAQVIQYPCSGLRDYHQEWGHLTSVGYIGAQGTHTLYRAANEPSRSFHNHGERPH